MWIVRRVVSPHLQKPRSGSEMGELERPRATPLTGPSTTGVVLPEVPGTMRLSHSSHRESRMRPLTRTLPLVALTSLVVQPAIGQWTIDELYGTERDLYEERVSSFFLSRLRGV